MRILFALAASATAIAAAPAAAAGPNATDFESQIVHEDLDLTTESGVSTLDERVKTIIRRNCANGGRDRESIRLERKCRATAFAAAKREIRVAVADAQAKAVRLASTKPVAPEA